VVESAAAGNYGRILTARSKAASLAAVRRRNGSGQRNLTGRESSPSSPTNRCTSRQPFGPAYRGRDPLVVKYADERLR
jgi:hypothetical protein